MRGKNKCKILKQIRQKIADENDIPYVTQECTFQGECKGTCPKCEAELRYLEQQLEKRQRLGKTVTVAALAASLMAGLTACPAQSAPVQEALSTSESELTEFDGVPVEYGDLLSEPIETEQVIGEVEAETQWVEDVKGAIEEETDLTSETKEIFELEGDVEYIPDESADEIAGGIAPSEPQDNE